MRYLNASDHRWLCIENDNNPLQIGALIFLSCEGSPLDEFVARARQHLIARLPNTPWQVKYARAPFDIDSGVWLDVGEVDIDRVTNIWPASATMQDIKQYVCEQVMLPLPRDRPPFRVTFFPYLDQSLKAFGDVAMLVQHHHAVADGIGFQSALEALMDDPAHSEPRTASLPRREHRPIAPIYMVQSLVRSRTVKRAEESRDLERAQAASELEMLRADPAFKRQRTPELAMLEGATQRERTYGFVELDLTRVKQRSRELGGTVNDFIMTVIGGATRRYLAQVGALNELGEKSVIGLMPRSLRSADDGLYGNYLTMVLPSLGTHIEDHVERFVVVQKSIRAEIRRSQLTLQSVPKYEKPFTARQRLKPEVGTSAGNLSVSNVPGPDSPRWFAGYRMLANFPTPSLVAGQLMNVTLRRYCNSLQLGLMSEPSKISDPDKFASLILGVAAEI